MSHIPAKHKRKGPKSTRGGCLFCKPWKAEGTSPKDEQRHRLTVAIDGALRDELQAWEAASIADFAKFEMGVQ